MKKKIVLATDSFKGTLSSMEIIDELENPYEKLGRTGDCKGSGGRRRRGNDGSACRRHGRRIQAGGCDRLLRNVRNVNYGVIHGDMAVIEMAAIEGLGMLDAGKLDPLEASSEAWAR